MANQDLNGDWFEGSVLMRSRECLTVGNVRSKVSNRTCPKQNLSQQLNTIIMIDLADACADMSALADTSAARTTDRMMTCTCVTLSSE